MLISRVEEGWGTCWPLQRDFKGGSGLFPCVCSRYAMLTNECARWIRTKQKELQSCGRIEPFLLPRIQYNQICHQGASVLCRSRWTHAVLSLLPQPWNTTALVLFQCPTSQWLVPPFSLPPQHYPWDCLPHVLMTHLQLNSVLPFNLPHFCKMHPLLPSFIATT